MTVNYSESWPQRGSKFSQCAAALTDLKKHRALCKRKGRGEGATQLTSFTRTKVSQAQPGESSRRGGEKGKEERGGEAQLPFWVCLFLENVFF